MLSEDAVDAVRQRSPFWTSAVRVAAGLAFVIVCLSGLRLGRRYDILAIGRSESIYPRAVRWASTRVPPRSLVFAMQFSGAMETYGLGTMARWDWMERRKFPGFRRRAETEGYGLYALMFPFEVRDAAPRLPGNWKYLGGVGDASLWRLEP